MVNTDLTKELVTDPVCEMEFPADTAAATLRFNKHTYYFCHVACLRLFEADPLAYMAGDLAPDEVQTIDKHP